MFPLRSPPRILPIRAIVNEVEKPTIMRDTQVPTHPSNKIGLRPYRSLSEPHIIELRASAKENDAMRMPQ